MSQRNPTNWDEYQYGTSPQRSLSQGSVNSARSVHFDGRDGTPSEASGLLEQGGRRDMDQELRRRRYVCARKEGCLVRLTDSTDHPSREGSTRLLRWEE